MATATAQRRDVKEFTFVWEGFDRNNRQVRGESRAASETVVSTNLRRQGIRVTRIKKQTFRGGRRVGEKDVTFFTRQLATMLRAGVPLLQAFDIVARGPRQCTVLAAHARHQGPHRGGLEPVAGVPRASGPVRCPVLQSGERRRDFRHARRDPRPARDLQGKDPRHQGQDQGGAVLSDFGDRRRDHRGLGHHGLGDPGVQAGVHQFRRGPAGARR